MNAKHVAFPGSGHNDPANTEDAAPDPHGFIANLLAPMPGCAYCMR
ncbi:hypothetical protein [Stenotrophomonas cyclobalanopsidis]